MAIKQELDVLLNKKMDRKDFLKHVGIAVVAVTGISALTRALVTSGAPRASQQQLSATRNDGYGGSAYGGSAKVS